MRALSNALDNDRLHHAYLFTGTRGVGKTTLARILSKSLNCEQGVSSLPCGECSICKEVDEGRFVDLLEVDAASKTGVDDTRDLLENVPYAPVRGRYKVYLIDEVHMFSNHSFNALLKTLEEPPPHVKFLLATTDPQKVPVTVLSRCLQFNLKRLPIEQIQGQFERLLEAEHINAETEALAVLARAADGSMRDGLSLLDQAIAFGGGEVKAAEVRDMLGVVATDQLPDLLSAVYCGQADAVLAMVELLSERAPDFSGLLKELLTLLHRVALVQVSAAAMPSSWGDTTRIQSLAAELSAEDVQLYYQIALVGQRDLPLAPDARSGFEMILLRMLAFRPDVPDSVVAPRQNVAKAGAALPGQQQKADPRQRRSHAVQAQQTVPAKPIGSTAEEKVQKIQPQAVTAEVPEKPALTPADVDFSDWHQVLARLNLRGMAAQLAHNCGFGSWDGRKLTLVLEPSFDSMLGSLPEERLGDALNEFAGGPVKLKLQLGKAKNETPAQRQEKAMEVRQQQAEQDISADPLVQGMQEVFDAEVVEKSVKPVEN